MSLRDLTNTGDTMNKLLVVTALVALLAVGKWILRPGWKKWLLEHTWEKKIQNGVTFDQSLVFCGGAESFRVPRQAVEEEGTLSKIADFFQSGYKKVVSTANSYVETIKGLEIEDKLQ